MAALDHPMAVDVGTLRRASTVAAVRRASCSWVIAANIAAGLTA
jgi:hypothetical protein